MEGIEALCNAIVLSAVKDYRVALKLKAKGKTSNRPEYDIDSLERFFRSEWFSQLTSIDGEMLIRKLQEEQQWTS